MRLSHEELVMLHSSVKNSVDKHNELGAFARANGNDSSNNYSIQIANRYNELLTRIRIELTVSRVPYLCRWMYRLILKSRV